MMNSPYKEQEDGTTMMETLPLHEHDEFMDNEQQHHYHHSPYSLVSTSGSDLSCLSSTSSRGSTGQYSHTRARSRSQSHVVLNDSNDTDDDVYTDNPHPSYMLLTSPRNGTAGHGGLKRSRTTWLTLAAVAGAGALTVAALAVLSSSPSSTGGGGADYIATGIDQPRSNGEGIRLTSSHGPPRLRQSFIDGQDKVYDPLGLSSADDLDSDHDAFDSSSSNKDDEDDDDDKEIMLEKELDKEEKAMALAAATSSVPLLPTTPAVPPLSELVQEEEVQGDISWMMDFAIIGNPKCGTTFLMHWLARNDDTFVHNGEVCSLSKDEPHELATMYYDQVTESGRMALTAEGHRIKGGLKCPKEISTEKGLDNWNKFFPNTKFIVTTRHPVLWFQSFYNYHAYGQYPKPVPHPNELIGACYDNSPYLCTDHCGTERAGNSKICTNRANFHHSLSRLGKTPMNTPEELSLLDHDMSIVPQNGKVFLMEISQLFPENAASEHLPDDISNFLDLKYDLHPLKERHGTGTHNHEYTDEEAKQAFVDICDDAYAPVREVLIQQGKDAAKWIKKYFMKSKDVVVSSPKEFVMLLDKWGEDPCHP